MSMEYLSGWYFSILSCWLSMSTIWFSLSNPFLVMYCPSFSPAFFCSARACLSCSSVRSLFSTSNSPSLFLTIIGYNLLVILQSIEQ